MRKRILAAVLAAVMLGGIAVMPASATNDDGNRTYDVYCEGCGALHTWYSITGAADALTEGHYFLAFAGNSLTMARKTISKPVCLLLENKEWVGNRHIILKSGAVLNVQGPGVLSGRGEDLDKQSNATYGDDGGAVRILEGAVCNLHGGTMTYTKNDSRNIQYGGVLSVHGTFNLYKGEVKDGIAQVAGGTVYVGKTGVMNLYGGSITGGKIIDATPADYCVYNSGKITLANDAVVEAAYLAPTEGGPALSEMITVAEGYSGSIALYLAPEITLTNGLALGKVEGDLKNADITLPGTGYLVAQDGDKLVAKWPALVENTTTGAEYATLQEAFSQAVMGDTLRLNRDTDETVTLDRTVTLELSGNSIAGVSVAQDFTLYVQDSKTADFSITDGDYGVIKTVSGDVQGAPVTQHTHAYMKHTDTNGTSFHAVGLDLTAVNLRPEAAGMYYTAMFTGDSAVVSQVAAYGIAMSVTDAPTAENMDQVSKYTTITEGFGTAEANGSLLQNILRPENRERDNIRNAQIPVYGAAYVQLQDGTRITGEAFSLSLQALTEAVDAVWDTLDYPQRDGIMNMYDKYSAIMDGWNIPNIQKALSEEDKVLRILSIGQSHSQDAIWLLQEVLQTERPDEQFYVAECIRSVTMVDHVKNAKTDNPIYTYYVNTDGKWVENADWTIRQALKAQRWDMVIINESCRYLGLESVMQKGYVHEMAQFVHDQLDYDFKLMYNWHWTIPVSQVFYMEGFEPAASSSFWSTYNKDYQANREVHYNAMKAMVEKYIETDALIDGIFYTGTTIQYATEVLGMPEAELSGEDTPKLHQQLTDRSMYRDYIHLSDYGRLFAAYQEYAQIYGLEKIDAVNVDVIEAHLRQWRWVPEGDVPLTQEMKDAIVESVNYTLQHPKEIIKK